MHKIRTSVVLLLVALFFSGCDMPTRSQLKLIKAGVHPTVTTITSIPNELYIEYIGFTAFDNGTITHQLAGDFSGVVNNEIHSLIAKDNIVNLADLKKADYDEIYASLPKKMTEYWKDGFQKTDISVISKWGRDRQIDYVTFIFPEPYYMYEPPALLKGKGILVNRNFTSLYATYQFIVVDTAKSSIADNTRMLTMKNIPTFKKVFSDADKDKIVREWEYEKEHSYNPNHEYDTREIVIQRKSLYTKDDFSQMTSDATNAIDQQLIPIINQDLQKILTKIGYINRSKSNRNKETLELCSECITSY